MTFVVAGILASGRKWMRTLIASYCAILYCHPRLNGTSYTMFAVDEAGRSAWILAIEQVLILMDIIMHTNIWTRGINACIFAYVTDIYMHTHTCDTLIHSCTYAHTNKHRCTYRRTRIRAYIHLAVTRHSTTSVARAARHPKVRVSE